MRCGIDGWSPESFPCRRRFETAHGAPSLRGGVLFIFVLLFWRRPLASDISPGEIARRPLSSAPMYSMAISLVLWSLSTQIDIAAC